MEPVLSGVAREPGLAVGTVNPRDDPVLVDTFDVTSVPLLVLFRDGDVVARRAEVFVGVDELRDWIDEHRRDSDEFDRIEAPRHTGDRDASVE